MNPAATASTDLLAALQEVVGPRNVLEAAALEPYRHDATFMEGDPVAAVLPATAGEVSAVLRVCQAARVPVVARGQGTSLVGGSVPLSGGIVLSLERLNGITVDAGDLIAVAGAGAITGAIQEAAAAQGLMYPPDPASASMSSIGGNVACNAGGMCCLKYGLTADYVLGAEVVLADGTVLRLGGRTRKRSSGYRLLQLFVGSEGTLGVITEVTLKLLPRPQHRATAVVGFAALEEAGSAVTRLLAAGYLPSALEVMDREALRLVSAWLPSGFGAGMAAMLLVEQDGNDSGRVLDDVLAMVELLGGLDSRIAQSAAESERLWKARKDFGRALMAIPKNYFAEDIAVPISAIPEMLRRITKLASESGLRIATAGHAGDGNLHPAIIFDETQRELVGPAAQQIFADAVSLGGTISAEHGLGALKRDHAALEHQPEALAIWQFLKQSLDPRGILNPHKVFPEGPADSEFLTRQPGWGAGRHSEPGV